MPALELSARNYPAYFSSLLLVARQYLFSPDAEEIVDLLWKQKIQPLLLKRFPDATEEDLRKAHAYAYGGCVLQDMGYYPFATIFQRSRSLRPQRRFRSGTDSDSSDLNDTLSPWRAGALRL